MTRDIESRFERMLSADMDAAEKNLMVRDESGEYYLFGRYRLREQQDRTLVIMDDTIETSFGSLRAAVSWCIAEKFKQNQLAKEIERLDRDLERVQANYRVLTHVADTIKDRPRKITAEIKRREAQLRCQALRERMADCVLRAKYFQIRGFNDEIARTRRPAHHRTNQSIAGKSGR